MHPFGFHENRAQSLLESLFGQELRNRGISKRDLVEISKVCWAELALFPVLPKVIPGQFADEHAHITVAEEEFGSDGETFDGIIARAKEIKPIAVKVNQPITANSAWLVALTDASFHNVSVLDLSSGGIMRMVEMQLLTEVLLQTRVSVLNLSSLSLTFEVVEPLLSVISQTHISCLDLSDNDFTDGEGVLRVLGMEFLKETCKLRELFLDHQEFLSAAIDSFLADLIKAPGGIESLTLYSRLNDIENEFNNIQDLCQLMKMGSLTWLEVNLHPWQLDEFHEALIHPACNLLDLTVRVLTGSRDVRLVSFLQAFKHHNCKVNYFELSVTSFRLMQELIDVLESPSCKLNALVLPHWQMNHSNVSRLAGMIAQGRCPSLNSLSMSFIVDDNLKDEDLKSIINALRSPMCFIKEFDITDGPFSDEFINSVQVFMSNMQVARRMIALRSATTRLGRASAMRNLPSELIRLVARMLVI